MVEDQHHTARSGRKARDEFPALPGDALISLPRKVVTHTIAIGAPPEKIWPWLLQLGAGRGGWYSYDRIDNGGKPSAETVIPNLQHVQVGDILPAVPHSRDAFIVREIHPFSALVLVVPFKTASEDPEPLNRMMGPLRVSWTLALRDTGQGKTVLFSRARLARNWLASSSGSDGVAKHPIFIERVYGLLAKLPWPLMAPIALTGHRIMESRMLHGIRRRAEASSLHGG